MSFKKYLPLIMICLLTVSNAFAARLLSLVDEQPAAVPFTLHTVTGEEVSLRDYENRVVVVNFWATWCIPCREEIPSLNRAAEWLKKYDVAMLAVNVGEDPDAVAAFLEQYPVDFPVLLDREMKVSGDWKATGLPTTYVVDPKGRIVYRAVGSREWDAPEVLVPIRALGLPR